MVKKFLFAFIFTSKEIFCQQLLVKIFYQQTVNYRMYIYLIGICSGRRLLRSSSVSIRERSRGICPHWEMGNVSPEALPNLPGASSDAS